ncbi:Basic-leucine zipper domain [Macleaya cordata]|uniref:Basic-leucine zipper domain n=1 Tax=Macleaya cordata TaxID=56857 RepID=A0A200QYE4_MACCD|nr:Basic-leucine zipper domain [Macleaya cordata]
MASSKVMASSTSANSDLARQPSTYSLTIPELQGEQSKNFGSMNMDELLRNIYGDNSTAEIIQGANGDGESNGGGGISLSRQGSFSLPKNVSNKTADEVWKEITTNGDDRKVRNGEEDEEERPFSEMTLEAFLEKSGIGAPPEDDVRISNLPTVVGQVTGIVIDSPFPQQHIEGSMFGFGNGVEGRVGGTGRGKRRAVQEPIDKVAQQRQRRMIKNRESAARSRERKQAYTVELETLVTQLEEENTRLVREQVLSFYFDF